MLCLTVREIISIVKKYKKFFMKSLQKNQKFHFWFFCVSMPMK